VFVVDTNILVYAADEDAPEHQRCRELLLEWRAQVAAWYTTWPILYELLRVLTHPRVFRTPWSLPKAWTYVEAILASPGLQLLVPSDRHQAVAAEVFRNLPDLRGNLLHDAHTAVLMLEHGIRRICTRDTDFHRFDFLEPVDPLRS
jgi:uncharacterized protein